MHIGVGGFHRAHLAVYIDQLCNQGVTDWAIVGAGVLPHDERIASALTAQDGMYTLISRGADTTDVQIIGSIVDFIEAWKSPDQLVDQIAAATTQIVSLTITEGGYPINDATGAFDPDSRNAADSGAFGLLTRGLARRATGNGGPLTVLSCDNILGNGHTTRTAVLAMTERLAPEALPWVTANVSFPNSMVDRITPATADSDRAWLAETEGINDHWPVVAEPFIQWVVEDAFAGDRPPLEKIDVIVTSEVEPYEFMKLRLLNAGHSCLAYLSALLGIEKVHEAMADDHIRRFVSSFLHLEAQPVLEAVPGVDVDAYIATLIERFSNPNIGDQISRLCLDGSAKFPKFLLPTIVEQLKVGGPIQLASLALAGWCQYLSGTTEDGASIDLADDPRLDSAVELARASETNPAAFLTFGAVFDGDLASSPEFTAAFVGTLELLRSKGVRESIDAILNQP